MSDSPDRTAPRTGVAPWKLRLAEVLVGGHGALLLPLACAVILVLYGILSSDQYWLRELGLIAVSTFVVSGVNLSFGYAGEIQFGQIFMFGLGAYVTMALATRGLDEIIVLLLIGGLVAAVFGFLIALPALRIGGWSLAMASFFLVITIPDLVAIFEKYTGGANGLYGIPAPKLLGNSLGTTGLYEVTIVAAILWLACYRNLVTSRYGVTFRVLRESPVLASSLGFSPSRLKALAYALGAFPAGVAGCLFGFTSLIIAPSNFGLNQTIGAVAASVLGGVESVYGAAFGAAVLQLGPEKSLSFADKAPVVYGVFLIFAAIVLRRGVGGLGKLAALRVSRALVGEAESAKVISAGSLSAHVAEHPLEKVAALEARSGTDIGPLNGRRLEVREIAKHFGGVAALGGVSLAAEPGQVTALIGSNGSGKTTLLNVVCGYARPDEGDVVYGDEKLTGLPGHAVALRGIGRTFQTPAIPRGVSVLDVVASARFQVDRCGMFASIFRLPRYWRSREADRAHALLMLEFVGLAALADEEAGQLSLGMRRLVEVARALCAQPGLLLLDEPASGLSPEEVQLLGRVVRAAADAGATVILIEHNFGFVASIADTAHVLHLGSLLASGAPAELGRDPRVIASYLGEGSRVSDVREPPPEPADGAPRPTMLSLDGAVSGYGDLRVLQGVSLDVPAGTIEVVLGRNGVGKTTLLAAIAGQLPLWEGRLEVDGQDLTKMPVYRRTASGIALVQEGKRIFRDRTILENIVLGTHAVDLGRAERRELCEALLDDFPVLKQRAGERAGALSGGQQQMLAIAQALASRPRVLLLDEPSAGLAPSIVEEVFDRVRALADTGLTVLLVEQVADQALRIGDHLTVLDDGRVVASGSPVDFHDKASLQEAYFGTMA